MKVFLIILAVLVLIIAVILSLSATFTIIYDESWTTTIKVLWIEKDIELSKLLSFILFPEENAKKAKDNKENKKQEKENQKAESSNQAKSSSEEIENAPAEKKADDKKKPQKPNYIKKLYNEEGIVGIMTLVSNLIETASSALGTLFRDFHIYSLYVKIIVGGYDAAEIAERYGIVCRHYYPIKGIILNGMKVDNYDDLIQPDFIAPESEYGLQFIGSVNVKTLLKVVLSAGKVFVINLIKNK